MSLVIIVLALGAAVIIGNHSEEQAAEPVAGSVKQSTSGICHAPQSPHYGRVTHFTAYETLADCVANGGSLPVNR